MTRLIIGGESQGKLKIALTNFKYSDNDVYDSEKSTGDTFTDKAVINKLHTLTRKILEDGGALDDLLDKLVGKTVICNEIGCGIVPMDAFERKWREATGRLCCDLAQKADVVIRVHCGIAQQIKGEAQ